MKFGFDVKMRKEKAKRDELVGILLKNIFRNWVLALLCTDRIRIEGEGSEVRRDHTVDEKGFG